MPCEWISPGTVVINVAAQPNVCEDSVLAIPGVRYVPKIGASFRVGPKLLALPINGGVDGLYTGAFRVCIECAACLPLKQVFSDPP